MPKYYQMLQELYDAVDQEEIINDSCEHLDPADPYDFCAVCFIMNLYENVSEDDPEFTNETTETQRETIQSLWERYCDS